MFWAWDPNATVVIYPSDHFVFPEHRFVETVQRAIRSAEVLRDRLIVLGVRPTSLELEYGWMKVGSPIGWSTGSCVQQVKSFVEKPEALAGLAAMAGGGLWNTLVCATKAETLWNLGWQCFPEVMERFDQLRKEYWNPTGESDSGRDLSRHASQKFLFPSDAMQP